MGEEVRACRHVIERILGDVATVWPEGANDLVQMLDLMERLERKLALANAVAKIVASDASVLDSAKAVLPGLRTALANYQEVEHE